MSINYIIATHAQNYKRREKYGDIYSKYCLNYHLQILNDLININSQITQITIVCPQIADDSDEYYKNNIVHIDNLRKKNIIVEILLVENKGISYGQYLQAYNKYNTFDYYIIMEDDWIINTFYKNFEKILLNLYKNAFTNNIGFLDTWSPVEGFNGNGFFSSITLGMLSNQSFKIFSNNTVSFENLNQINFSKILLDSNVYIKDLIRANFPNKIIFWETCENLIKDYTENNTKEQPFFVPIQYYYKNVTYKNMKNHNKYCVENIKNIFNQ